MELVEVRVWSAVHSSPGKMTLCPCESAAEAPPSWSRRHGLVDTWQCSVRTLCCKWPETCKSTQFTVFLVDKVTRLEIQCKVQSMGYLGQMWWGLASVVSRGPTVGRLPSSEFRTMSRAPPGRTPTPSGICRPLSLRWMHHRPDNFGNNSCPMTRTV